MIAYYVKQVLNGGNSQKELGRVVQQSGPHLDEEVYTAQLVDRLKGYCGGRDFDTLDDAAAHILRETGAS